MGSHSNPESPTAVGRIRTRTDHATEGISAVPESETLLVGGCTFTKKLRLREERSRSSGRKPLIRCGQNFLSDP